MMLGAVDGREIAHAAQQAAGDARRAARAAGDLHARRPWLHRRAEHAGAARHDQFEFVVGVEVEPDRNAEAVAQRIGQQAGARRRADERELRQVDA